MKLKNLTFHTLTTATEMACMTGSFMNFLVFRLQFI